MMCLLIFQVDFLYGNHVLESVLEPRNLDINHVLTAPHLLKDRLNQTQKEVWEQFNSKEEKERTGIKIGKKIDRVVVTLTAITTHTLT